MSRIQNIPLAHRTFWMSERHLKYGKPIRMTNLDQFGDSSYLEYETDVKLSHLADWKNELEKIEMWNFGIKAQSRLATNSNIPFFIIVGYRDQNCFYVIPVNQIAKDLKWVPEWANRWISERNYVKMLYSLRGLIPTKEDLKDTDNTTPTTTIKPNVEW